jgi:RNA polymerase sigma-B factor
MIAAATTSRVDPAPAPNLGDPRIDLLFRRCKREDDCAARETLVTHFLPLARKLAWRYAHSSEPFEDLVQVASLALVKAIDRFDPDRGTGFATFAIPTILGELRRYFRDCAWSVHVPRAAQERAARVSEAIEQLTTLHGKPPTAPELARYLELSLDEILDGLCAGQAYATKSLDASPEPLEYEAERTVGETLGAEDEHYELIEADAAVAQALRSLSERERRILRMRFLDEMTQSEIAAQMRLSQMQISRLLRRSLDRLRELAGAEDDNRASTSRQRIRSTR